MLHTIEYRNPRIWLVKCMICSLTKKSSSCIKITSSLQSHQATYKRYYTALKQNTKVRQALKKTLNGEKDLNAYNHYKLQHQINITSQPYR